MASENSSVSTMNYSDNSHVKTFDKVNKLRAARKKMVVKSRKHYDESVITRDDPDKIKNANAELEKDLALVTKAMDEGKDLKISTEADPNDPSFFKLLEADVIPDTEALKKLNSIMGTLETQLDKIIDEPRRGHYSILLDQSNQDRARTILSMVFNWAKVRVQTNDIVDEDKKKVRDAAQKIIKKTSEAIIARKHNFRFNAHEREAVLNLSLGASGNVKKLGESLSSLSILDTYNPYRGEDSKLLRFIGNLWGGGPFGDLLGKSFASGVDFLLTRSIDLEVLETSRDYPEVCKHIDAYYQKLVKPVKTTAKELIAGFAASTDPDDKKIVANFNQMVADVETIVTTNPSRRSGKMRAQQKRLDDAIQRLAQSFLKGGIAADKDARRRNLKNSVVARLDDALGSEIPKVVEIPNWGLKAPEMVTMLEKLYSKNSSLISQVESKVDEDAKKRAIKDELESRMLQFALDELKSQGSEIKLKYQTKSGEVELKGPLADGAFDVDTLIKIVEKVRDRDKATLKNRAAMVAHAAVMHTLVGDNEEQFAIDYGTGHLTLSEWNRLNDPSVTLTSEDRAKLGKVMFKGQELARRTSLSSVIDEWITKKNTAPIDGVDPKSFVIDRNNVSDDAVANFVNDHLLRRNGSVLIPEYKAAPTSTSNMTSRQWEDLRTSNYKTITAENLHKWFVEGNPPTSASDPNLKDYQDARAYARDEIARSEQAQKIEELHKSLKTSIAIYDNLLRGHSNDNAAWTRLHILANNTRDPQYSRYFGSHESGEIGGLVGLTVEDEKTFSFELGENSKAKDRIFADKVRRGIEDIYGATRDEFVEEGRINSTARQLLHQLLSKYRGVIADKVGRNIIGAFHGEQHNTRLVEHFAKTVGKEVITSVESEIKFEIMNRERSLNSVLPNQAEEILTDGDARSPVSVIESIRKNLDKETPRTQNLPKLREVLEAFNGVATTVPSPSFIEERFEDRVDPKEKKYETWERKLKESQALFEIFSSIVNDPEALSFAKTKLKSKLSGNSMATAIVDALNKTSFISAKAEDQKSKIDSLLTKFEDMADKEQIDKLKKELREVSNTQTAYSGDTSTRIGKEMKQTMSKSTMNLAKLFLSLTADPEYEVKRYQEAMSDAEKQAEAESIPAKQLFLRSLIPVYKEVSSSHASAMTKETAKKQTEEAVVSEGVDKSLVPTGSDS